MGVFSDARPAEYEISPVKLMAKMEGAIGAWQPREEEGSRSGDGAGLLLAGICGSGRPYVLENYRYAPEGYLMLRVGGTGLDEGSVLCFDGEGMYYSGDGAYLPDRDSDTGAFFTLIPEACAEMDGASGRLRLKENGALKLSVRPGLRRDAERNGDVNGDGRVDMSDANAVYRMLKEGGGCYSVDELGIRGRLGADCLREDYSESDCRGTLADVHAILARINSENG